MASRKEYEMLFKLNAQVNSGYSSAFKSAQASLTQMQNGLQALNKAQSDIASYQKQQTALENTRNKLQLLQQQYDNIQREISETEGFSASLENQLLSKQKQIEKTTESIARQEDKLDQLGASLQKAGVNTENLTGESQRLEAEYAQLQQEQMRVAEGFRDGGESADAFGSKSVDAVQSVESALAAAGIVVALKEIAAGYQECVSVAGDFEESMSNVEALSGANSEDIAELSAMAKELGATTKFTAKESADAMGYMAMAGWDTQQMLAGMPGVLKLAAASGEDLARVSDIVTDSMTAFGLTAADTNRYADVLAATATNANTSVSVMGESFKYAAPVAGALGYSIEDISVALGLMANAGIKGSNAGTALRNTFNGLLEGVRLTGAAIGEVEFSAVQADGTMMSWGSTIDTLRGYFEQMTAAERTNNAMAIAGQRGYAGLLSILNATDADYSKLTDSINNCSGAAEHMSNVKLDNMNGQLTLLNSAWEAVQTTVGEQFTPTLQELYGTGAAVLSQINAFLQANPAVIKVITALAIGTGSVAAALAAYILVAKAATAIQNALNASMISNPAIALIGAFIGLTTAAAALGIMLSEAKNDQEELTATSREQYNELQELNVRYEEMCNLHQETSVEAQLLKREIDELTESYEENKQTVGELAAEQEAVLGAYQESVEAYQKTIEEIDKESESNLNLISRLQGLISVERKSVAAKQEILTVVDMLNESVPNLGLSYNAEADSLNLTAEAIRNVAAAEAERKKNEADYTRLQEALAQRSELEATAAKAEAELKARQKELDNAKAALKNARGDNYNPYDVEQVKATRQYAQAVEDAQAALDQAKTASEEATTAEKSNTQQIEELSQEIAEYSQASAEAEAPSLELAEALNPAIEKAQELAEAYQEAYESAYSGISGSFGLFDKVAVEVEKSVSGMISSLESQASYMATYSENLQKAAAMGLSEGLIAQLSDGSVESAAYLQEIVNNGSGKIEELNAAFGKVEEGKDKFATTVAEMQTDFSESMDALQSELETTISEMDLNAEAAESGYNTIEGFISAAQDPKILSRVSQAYANIANAASNAIGSGSGTTPPRKYASGTQSAESGIALVGEEGPELVFFNGGERVMTATETEALKNRKAMQEYVPEDDVSVAMLAPQVMAYLQSMRSSETPIVSATPSVGGGVTINIQPTYHIETTRENSQEIEEQLQQHDVALREMIREELEEIGIDARRVSFT